ncbi:hypothetical protein DNTS_012418 [Danionella cerebrum]|uniref:Ras-associating domain-containing protein n=1 Tax=Danionella cerebrum TaxID=2873325 RepID=A0A553QJD1_9TELE|nr:hypothetical protein DNTS_012418 [Danionella translucida]
MSFQARRVTLPAITPLCLQKRSYIFSRACSKPQPCPAPSTVVIKVYSEDNSSRAVEVPSDTIARDICQLFILKNQCRDDHSWTLFEQIPHLSIERTIEDHECVMEVQSGWGMDSHCCLYFRKNYAKYEFFKKPLDFFPEHMVTISSETNGIMNHSQLVQVVIFYFIFYYYCLWNLPV